MATRREGTRIHYRLAGRDVAALYALLQQVARDRQAAAGQARTAYLGPEDTDRLTREELLERVKAGTATVIDVRPAEEYAAGHIPGAVSIPLEELEARLAELPEGADIVAYCRGANCVLAHDAVRLLAARGRAARRLADGMLEWYLAGLPVAAGLRRHGLDQPDRGVPVHALGVGVRGERGAQRRERAVRRGGVGPGEHRPAHRRGAQELDGVVDAPAAADQD